MKVSGKSVDNNRLPYMKQTEEGWETDTAAIEKAIENYVEQAAGTERYSISGLCIALGITREVLELWRAGYVCREDEADRRVMPNAELAECVAMGELYIHRYWEESDKATTLHTKFLESAGVIGCKQTGARPPFDLGSLKKYSR